MLFGRKIIALCTSRVYDAGHHRFIRVLNDNLSKFNYRLFIYTLNTDLYWNEEESCAETKVYDLIPYDKIDGLIVMDEKIKSKRITDSICQKARAAGLPIISVDGEHEGALTVRFDYEKGFESIVRHVIEYHGVRRPHFLAGIKGNEFSESRLNVFKKVIKENGIEFDESMLSYGDFWAKPSREAAEELCSRDELPEAVICANDVMAINVNDIFRKHGYRVPKDVIITGFDGIDEAQYSIPKLSTVSTDWADLADALSKAVFDYFGRKKTEGEVKVVPRLIPNESCGCERVTETSDTYLSKLNDSFYRYQDDTRNLYEISVKMQMSTSPGQAIGYMYDFLMHDMCLVIKKEIFERAHNFILEDIPPQGLALVYDSYHSYTPMTDFDCGEIAPELEQKLEDRHPLIFNALDYMGKNLGFICYSFKNYDITDYTKTATINNTVSMGLGGYVNMQYQLYLSDKVERMYKNDKLTGLYTRTGYEKYYRELIERSKGPCTELTVIMSDLNGLKAINDSFGHIAGDIAITAAARALKSCTPEDRTVCVRYGGDEMIALIVGEADPDRIIADIDKYLDDYNAGSGLKFIVSTSCGAFCKRLDEGFDLEYAIKQADKQMYETKRIKKQKMHIENK
ncbi:MAG: GGDEF domain-containing protein [Ruminococcus sp.]|nr:GGDEF domain-containing protein [Ruminococcus sp.]